MSDLLDDGRRCYQDGFAVRVPHMADPGWVRVGVCPNCGAPIWAWNDGRMSSEMPSDRSAVKLPEHKRSCAFNCRLHIP